MHHHVMLRYNQYYILALCQSVKDASRILRTTYVHMYMYM